MVVFLELLAYHTILVLLQLLVFGFWAFFCWVFFPWVFWLWCVFFGGLFFWWGFGGGFFLIKSK